MVDGSLRKIFRQHLPRLMWTSIESGLSAQGVPDSWYIAKGGVQGWVEYKLTMGWSVALRPAQIGWISQVTRFGGRVYIAVRRSVPTGARRRAADELWIVRGEAAAKLKSGGLRSLGRDDVVGFWDSGPGSWNWLAVENILMER
jgi:hypothetical protein